MSLSLFVLQIVNGIEYGLLLFLVASGLTLVFGVLGVLNFAHGSFYMLGAYLAYFISERTGSLPLAVAVGVPAMALLGVVVEKLAISRLYKRDHLSQVLLTYGLIPSFVVVVIGGIGSIKGAFLGALVVGLADTFGKVLIPGFASAMVYAVMAAVLLARPRGLFGQA